MPISNEYATLTFAELLRQTSSVSHVASTPTYNTFSVNFTTNGRIPVRWGELETKETKILAFGIGEGIIVHAGELRSGAMFKCHFPKRLPRYLVLGKDFIVLNKNEEFE